MGLKKVADMVRHVIDNYSKLTPAILEIPSKEHAYDPSKDYILKRAQVNYNFDVFVLKLKNLLFLFIFKENVFSRRFQIINHFNSNSNQTHLCSLIYLIKSQ